MYIKEFCLKYNLGTIIDISELSGGLMHKMYKVITDKDIYAIKVLNSEVMKRPEAYNNFIISETISNYAAKNNIPVSNALLIDNNYLNKFNNNYYMVFKFIEGQILSDEEITTDHCKKIGNLLASIHSLNYEELNLKPNVIEYKKLYDWESFTKNENFNKMSYKDLYLSNYKKYNSMLKRANERFYYSNNESTICHRDMDPKNVMWQDDTPIIIDWESACLDNPYRELLEDALCWSGFLSNDFDKEKFTSVFVSYFEKRKVNDIDWYNVICGNLVGRFDWLKYNLERSLGILSEAKEEQKLAENEVTKTINEINRYLELIETMYNIISKLTIKESYNYDELVKTIISKNDLLKNKSPKLVNSGFTNTIYKIGEFILRICTDINNEPEFLNEIKFYESHNYSFMPKLYAADTSKKIVPYYYEIIEKIEGPTLYEIWYKINEEERLSITKKIVDILKKLHFEKTVEYDFKSFIKSKLNNLLTNIDIDKTDLLSKCDIYFEKNNFSLIHHDLHFDNFIYNNHNLYLIDYEQTMSGPIDYDLRIFTRYKKTPWLWASIKTDMLTVEQDYQEFLSNLINNYEELNNIKYLKERLSIYSLIDVLERYSYDNKEELLQEIKSIINSLTVK